MAWPHQNHHDSSANRQGQNRGGRPKRKQTSEQREECVDDLTFAAQFAGVMPPPPQNTQEDDEKSSSSSSSSGSTDDSDDDDAEIDDSSSVSSSNKPHDSNVPKGKVHPEETQPNELTNPAKNDEGDLSLRNAEDDDDDDDDDDESDVDLSEALARMDDSEEEDETRKKGRRSKQELPSRRAAAPRTEHEVDVYNAPVEELEAQFCLDLSVTAEAKMLDETSDSLAKVRDFFWPSSHCFLSLGKLFYFLLLNILSFPFHSELHNDRLDV
jgi:hypothetical protein